VPFLIPNRQYHNTEGMSLLLEGLLIICRDFYFLLLPLFEILLFIFSTQESPCATVIRLQDTCTCTVLLQRWYGS